MTGRIGLYEDEHGQRVIGEGSHWGRRLRVYALGDSGGRQEATDGR